MAILTTITTVSLQVTYSFTVIRTAKRRPRPMLPLLVLNIHVPFKTQVEQNTSRYLCSPHAPCSNPAYYLYYQMHLSFAQECSSTKITDPGEHIRNEWGIPTALEGNTLCPCNCALCQLRRNRSTSETRNPFNYIYLNCSVICFTLRSISHCCLHTNNNEEQSLFMPKHHDTMSAQYSPLVQMGVLWKSGNVTSAVSIRMYTVQREKKTQKSK